MKISVLIPSCGRNSLGAVIGSLHGLSTGKHDITYCAGMDNKAIRTEYSGIDWPKTIYSHAPYPGSLGAIYNRLAAENPADIYCLFADDIFPLTGSWDEIIHTVHSQAPNNIFAWFDTSQPMAPKYPIVPHAWYKLAGDRIFTDHFPFWFDDMWLTEVYKMATGQDIIIPKQLTLGGRKGTTNHMRDLDFWWKFFSRTRVLRMKEAQSIKNEIGLEHSFSDVCQQVIRAGLDKDIAFKNRAPEKKLDFCDPDASYSEAKLRAENLLVEHRLNL